MTGDITVNAGNDTDVALKNLAPLSTCKTEINHVFVNETNLIYIPMPMYNSIEYSDNFSDKSRSIWQFKRDEVPANNADLGIDNNGNDNSQLFKYKVALLGKTADYDNLNSFVKKQK